jgi:hypothetical protein
MKTQYVSLRLCHDFPPSSPESIFRVNWSHGLKASTPHTKRTLVTLWIVWYNTQFYESSLLQENEASVTHVWCVPLCVITRHIIHFEWHANGSGKSVPSLVYSKVAANSLRCQRIRHKPKLFPHIDWGSWVLVTKDVPVTSSKKVDPKLFNFNGLGLGLESTSWK